MLLSANINVLIFVLVLMNANVLDPSNTITRTCNF